MSDTPHFGYIDCNRAYSLEELVLIMGVTDKKNALTKLKEELKVTPKRVLGRNWYSGRVLVLAIERAIQELNDNEDDAGTPA